MKSIYLLLVPMIFLVSCSVSPSPSTIQTAIAQTQVASPIIQEHQLYTGNIERLILTAEDISTQGGQFQVIRSEQNTQQWENEELRNDFINSYYVAVDFTFPDQTIDELAEVVTIYKTPEAAKRAYETKYPDFGSCENAPRIGADSCVWGAYNSSVLIGYNIRFYSQNVFVYFAQVGKTNPPTMDEAIFTARNIEAKITGIP